MTNQVSTNTYIPTNRVTHTDLSTMETKCQMSIHKDKQTIAQETCFPHERKPAQLGHVLCTITPTQKLLNIRSGIDLFLIRCINDCHSTGSYSIHRKMFLCTLMRPGSHGLYLAGGTSTDPSQCSTRMSSIITAVNSPIPGQIPQISRPTTSQLVWSDV